MLINADVETLEELGVIGNFPIGGQKLEEGNNVHNEKLYIFYLNKNEDPCELHRNNEDIFNLYSEL